MRALLSLAIGSFGIGMTEFVVMGLLPNIGRDLLPTAYAASPDDAIAKPGGSSRCTPSASWWEPPPSPGRSRASRGTA